MAEKIDLGVDLDTVEDDGAATAAPLCNASCVPAAMLI